MGMGCSSGISNAGRKPGRSRLHFAWTARECGSRPESVNAKDSQGKAACVVRQVTDGSLNLRHPGHIPRDRGTAMKTPTKQSPLAGLAVAAFLIGQLAVVMAGAAAVGWGKTSIESSLQPLAPAFEAVELGGRAL